MATNNLLQDAITNSQTTIEFLSANDFPQHGIAQIESELIKFEGSSDQGIFLCTRGYGGTTAATHAASKPVSFIVELFTGEESAVSQEITETYGDEPSHQTVAADLNVVPTVGRTKAQGGSFIASIMGNIIGDALTKTGNYLAGLIGAISLTGTKASELPTGAVIGIAMDAVTEADGIFIAVVDGSDPSSVTRANAAFKARQLNANAGSGVDYGVDLHDVAVTGYLTDPTLPLAIAKAAIRCNNQVCWLNGAGVPVDGTTGDNFAEKGSLYTDITNGNLYIQTSAITTPVWKLVTRAA